jgi:adenosylmethionine-8-amino-7-oxononanoate aminotransferase
MHSMFTEVLPRHHFAPRPPAGFGSDITGWEAETRALVERHADELAAIICEPVLQGAGGMHVYNPTCLTVLRQLADEHDLLLIFDEIATGFGRTGRMFASEWADVTPDIMCVGKALTGGYLTLAATLCTPEVAAAVSSSESGVLMHGPTFMANPLACAVASANLGLLIERGWFHDVHRIERGLEAGLAPTLDALHVIDVRVLGAVGVVQLDGPVDVPAASAAAARLGVWIRPFRDLIYTMPPYVMSDADVATVCRAVDAAARA